MPEAGFTPVKLYRSATPAATPSAGNLEDGELAINTADEALFAKNSSGDVKRIASGLGFLPVLDDDPVLAAGEGASYIKIVSGQPAVFIKVYGFDAIRLNVGADLNVSIPSSVLSPAAVTATSEVTATQVRGEPVTLTITDDGPLRVVECDLSIASNYYLLLDENVDEFRFINLPAGRVPNVLISIENAGAFVITIFEVLDLGWTVKVPASWGGGTSLSPPSNTVVDYGVAMLPGNRLSVYPVIMEDYTAASPSP